MRKYQLLGTLLGMATVASAWSQTDWHVTGNSGLDQNTNFIGTTDSVPLIFRSNNQQIMSLFLQQTTVNTDLFSGSNILAGWNANTINAGAAGSTVFGGLRINSTDYGNHAYDIGSTIAGGANNFAGRDDGFLFTSPYATVAGGVGNWASANASVVAGGSNNTASGAASVVPGGEANTAGGTWSFAGGRNAVVRNAAASGDANGDEGTFIWADSTASQFTSTGPNRFLVRASGGMGVGTANPAGQLDASGTGGFSFPQLVLTCTTNGTDSWSRVAFANSSTSKFWHFSAKCNGADSSEDQLNYYYQNAGQGRNIMQIRGDGRVALGGPLPEAGVTLTVGGTIKCTSLVQTSSRRYKTDVAGLPSVLDRFLRLRPVSFRWDAEHGGDGDVGLIAEEVAEVFPEAVATIDGRVEGINYSRVTALAIQAVKEQQQTVESLRAENAELKARVERIEKALSAPRP
ncbi:MAG: tail fiber domain-containing protein [Phycisphaerales bacterium]